MAAGNTPPSNAPSTIGRYQVVGELGRGAMGVVYRGFDPNVGRAVAIKTVLLDSGDPEVILRFKREAQAAGILSHPSIVTIYDAGEDRGLFYIAMEFVEGETVQAALRKGPMPMDRAVLILEQIGAALDHAHSRQIIHRDIKPANIVLTEERAKIMDFGVAKITAVGITTAGQAMGTPAYMSPEAVQGQVVDNRTDVFSLGVMFYEMIAGRRPFGGDSVATVMYKIMTEEVVSVASVNSEIPEAMDPVFKKVLAKNRDKRYTSCAEFIKDVKGAFREGVTTAPAAPAAHPAAQSPVPAAAPSVYAEPPPPSVASELEARRQSRMQRRVVPPTPPPAKVAIPYQVKAPSRAPKIVGMAAAVIALLGGGGFAFWKYVMEPVEERKVDVATPAKKTPKKKPADTPPDGDAAPVQGKKAAVPAPVPAPETLQVMIKANVDGASIRVDGRTQSGWVTPRTIPLTAGPHTIEVSKSGYRSTKKGVLLNATGNHEFTLNMTPEPSDTPAKKAAPEPVAPTRAAQPPPPVGDGSLRVISLPPGASITVDGKATPYRTPVIFRVPAGHHTVDLSHGRLGKVTREIDVPTDQIFELRVDLRPGGGR